MSLDTQDDELDQSGEDWNEQSDTFPDYVETRAMWLQGRIKGDEWISVGQAMPEFGDYSTPEEALSQRRAWDIAIRAVVIDRERIARALQAELQRLLSDATSRILAQVSKPQTWDPATHAKAVGEDVQTQTAYLSRVREMIDELEVKQELRGTGERRWNVLRLTLQGANPYEIAREIGRPGDTDTVKNDRRWLRNKRLLPLP